MPRMARAVVPGIPHHVTQRGDRREPVFLVKADYRRYLNLLKEYAGPRGLGIVAYCLMPNHVHLVVLPREEGSLASVLKPVHARYAQYMNWVHQMTGRRWQGRYFSCPMDNVHAAAAIRYVETNPVRAQLVQRAEEYRWSSAAGHAGLRRDDILSADAHEYADVEDWLAWLLGQDEDATIARLRRHTKTGRPLGDEAFVAFIEQKTGRVLKPKRAGRRPGTMQSGNMGSVPRLVESIAILLPVTPFRLVSLRDGTGGRGVGDELRFEAGHSAAFRREVDAELVTAIPDRVFGDGVG